MRSATRGDERSALAAEGAPGTLHARDSDAEPEPDADANDWTDQETLTLLEAIERHGEDWSSVASRVATKNAEQCVRRFARLPVEDAFLEALAKGAVVDATPSETPSEETPFAGASNPVMAVVAFLATCVGPRVAAAAPKPRSRAWPRRRARGARRATAPTQVARTSSSAPRRP